MRHQVRRRGEHAVQDENEVRAKANALEAVELWGKIECGPLPADAA